MIASPRRSLGRLLHAIVAIFFIVLAIVLSPKAGAVPVVDTGFSPSCVLKDDGTIVCFGLPQGTYNRISNPHVIPLWNRAPTRVGQRGAWRQLSVGYYHSCAIKKAGTLWCWGDNVYGELGNGNNATTTYTNPVQVGMDSDWIDISSGVYSTCGIRQGGSLLCWGLNASGQLGHGTTNNTNAPGVALVPGLPQTWTQVRMGGYHSCAIASNGSLWCWGANYSNQLGLGSQATTTDNQVIPQRVGTETDWASIAPQASSTCARKTDNSLWCWGDNSIGELGSQVGVSSKTPQRVGNASDWISVEGGWIHACGIRGINGAGSLWCWGFNGFDGAGNPGWANITTPTQVGTDVDWSNISAGHLYSCGVHTGGKVQCFGYNGSFDYKTEDPNQFAPVEVKPGTTWLSSGGGHHNSCAIRADRTLWCWGDQYSGGRDNALGDATNLAHPFPTRIGSDSDWASVSGSDIGGCGLKTNGLMYCWGKTAKDQFAVSPNGYATPTQMGGNTWLNYTFGYSGICAVRSDHTLWCWGNNNYGQTGTGTTGGKLLHPMQVGTDNTWKSVARGDPWVHNCAVKNDGSLWCWGHNGSGQLGDGSNTTRNVPARVGADTNWSSASVGGGRSCGLKTNNTLWCWGLDIETATTYANDAVGTTASLRRNVPQQVSGAPAFAQISLGTYYACGITTVGALYCNGQNYFGAVGVGLQDYAFRPQFLAVAPGKTWKALDTRFMTACATSNSDQLYCWGLNDVNQVGVGHTQGMYTVGDTTPPDTVITSSPAASTPNQSATFTFTSTKDGTFECSLDGGAYKTCSSPQSYPNVGGGSHTFAVRALDVLDNTDPTPATYSWTVTGDTAKPTTTIHNGPRNPTLSHTATFEFSSDERATYQCSIDNAAFTPCTSPQVYTGLANGSHNFHVYATDAAGNVESPIQSYTWVISGVRVAAAQRHSCVVRNNGDLWCWGANDRGQIGDGTQIDRAQPVRIGTAGNWVTVAAGEGHACAIRASDNSLWCWGDNRQGQLGLAGVVGKLVTTPTKVNNAQWADVATGRYHSCGLQIIDNSNTSLWCWGRNDSGQLGDGSNIQRSQPVKIGSATNWTAISLGGQHSIGLQGTILYVWGANDRGQLGISNFMSSSVPLKNTDMDWSSIAAGEAYTCGVRKNALNAFELVCTGANDFGQLGNNSEADAYAFQTVTPPWGRTWASVYAGARQACAIASDDKMSCWGENIRGAGGDGFNNLSSTPKAVTTTSTWITAAVGGEHACAADANAAIWCWGQRLSGQLGDNVSFNNLSLPYYQFVGGGDLFNTLGTMSGGGDTLCAINGSTAGYLFCWGAGTAGNIGDGNDRDRAAGSGVYTPLTSQTNPYWSQVAVGPRSACALKNRPSTTATGPLHTLWCWGLGTDQRLGGYSANSTAPLLRNPPAINGDTATFNDWLSVAVGGQHGCAVGQYTGVGAAQRLFCWGDNRFGQLGNGTATSTSSDIRRVLPDSEGNWSQVAAGARHSCALKTTGAMFCWGDNSAGQLGIGSNTPATVPVAVAAASTWKAVYTTGDTSCAIRSDNTLWCWGENQSGQLGLGSFERRNVPVQVGTGTDWRSLALGTRHACGIRAASGNTGTFWCWGSNSDVQLSLASPAAQLTPIQIGAGNIWAVAAVTDASTCVIGTDKKLYCIGNDFYGQVGDYRAWVQLPQQVPGL